MKKKILLVACVFTLSSAFAQSTKSDGKSGFITCTEFHITKPLREIFANNPNEIFVKKGESEDREHNRPQKFRKSVKDGPEYGNDPATMQTTMGTIPGKAPIKNYPGQTASGFYPLDPSGAAGPTDYVQMINATTFRVYNKTTGANLLTAILGNLWSPALTYNDGDPVVLYDKAADRWFLAQFGDNDGAAGNKIHIAISTTNDPTGSYYTYTYTSPAFPDYLKFSVWQDGYYMCSNQAQKVFTFERTAMLAGTPTARMVYQSFSPPNAGYFFVPLPGDAGDGTMPPAGTPCPIFSYSDNGWGTGYTDAINIYKVAVNWVPTTPTSTITSAGSVPTAAFDGSYDASWNDCSQPGTTQKLDGIGGVLMFRAQWKTWSTYNSVVLNWGVKISATQRSIKWCELHQNQSTGVWSMYQEGIYTPDANTRWLGSIAMDNNGSIGLSYLKSNSTSIYPSLCYTGRRTCDPLGTLPVTEVVAQAGAGSQTGINRDGDYSETWLDPDGITFWHTGEYLDASGAIQTRVYSYQITPCVASVPVANFSGTPTTVCAGQSGTYTDLSTNTPTSWAWTFAGGTPTTSTLQNPVVVYNTPGTYSVTLTATNAAGSSTPVTMTNYITVNAVPATPTATNTGPFCVGSIINLATPAVTGATYAWTGPASFSSALQNPTRPSATAAMAGTYSVTVTVGGCTSAAGTTAVVVTTPPVAIFSYTGTPYCKTAANPSPTFSGGGVVGTFTSTAGLVFVSASTGQVNLSASTAGTYTVTNTVGAAGGCAAVTATSTITITTPPVATFSYTGTPYCKTAANPSPTFSGGGVAGTFTSTAGLVFVSASTGQVNLSASTAGTYTVTNTVGASGGCAAVTATSTITITAPPVATFSYTGTPYCKTAANPSPTFSGGGVAGTFTSTAGLVFVSASTGQVNLSASTAGTYTVTNTVGAAGGCAAVTATSTITITTPPVATFSYTGTPYCKTAANPSPTFSGGGVAGTFTSTAGLVFVSASTGQVNLSASTAGTYTVTNTIGASGGCAAVTATSTITINPTPATPTAGSNSPVCVGSTLDLTTPTVSGATYSWAGPSGYSSTTQNPARPAATAAMAGTYSVTVTVSGCVSLVGTTVVVVNPVPATPTAGSNSPVCSGTSINLTTPSVTGATYAWTGPSTYSSATQTPILTAATIAMAGTYSVTVTVGGCTSAAGSTAVVVNAGPTALATTTVSASCGTSNGTINIGATTGGTGPYTYSVNGSGFTSTITYPGMAAGSYSVVVEDANGCTFTTSATITNSSGPTALGTTVVNETCGMSNGSITIGTATGGVGPYTYSFNASAYTSTTSYTGLPAGTYTINVKDANGCIYTTSVTITNIGSTPATPTITQVGLTLTSSSATGNQWYLNGVLIAGATGQTYTATTNGSYTVVVTTGGCASASSTSVVITDTGISEIANPYLLNIYPNPNDGNFTVSFNAQDKSNYKLELFNALGQLILKDELADYSGTYSKKLDVSQYGKGVYMITLTNSKNETVKKIIVY